MIKAGPVVVEGHAGHDVVEEASSFRRIQALEAEGRGLEKEQRAGADE